MILLVHVLGEELTSFQGKRGKVALLLCNCYEVSEHPLDQSFDLSFMGDEAHEMKGKLVGRSIRVAIKRLRMGQGCRLQATGIVLTPDRKTNR